MTDKTKLLDLITTYAQKHGVPTDVAHRLARAESSLNPSASSSKGARGIMQLMPDTARELGLTVNDKVDDRLDPTKNIDAGLRYLRKQYDRFGSWLMASAAYNDGPADLERHLAGKRELPAETKKHMQKVAGEPVPPTTAGAATVALQENSKLGLPVPVAAAAPMPGPSLTELDPLVAPQVFAPVEREQRAQVDAAAGEVAVRAEASRYTPQELWQASVEQGHIVPNLMAKMDEVAAAAAGFDPQWKTPSTDEVLDRMELHGVTPRPELVHRLRTAVNPQHFTAILRRMAMEAENERVLASKGVGVSFLMGLTGAVTDPLQYPFNAVPATVLAKRTHEAKRLENVAGDIQAIRRANTMTGAGVGALSALVPEVALAGMQETRSLEDAIPGILVSAVLGGAAGRMVRPKVTNIERLTADLQAALLRAKALEEFKPKPQLLLGYTPEVKEGEYMPAHLFEDHGGDARKWFKAIGAIEYRPDVQTKTAAPERGVFFADSEGRVFSIPGLEEALRKAEKKGEDAVTDLRREVALNLDKRAPTRAPWEQMDVEDVVVIPPTPEKAPKTETPSTLREARDLIPDKPVTPSQLKSILQERAFDQKDIEAALRDRAASRAGLTAADLEDASLSEHAGAYSLRQGPVLDENGAMTPEFKAQLQANLDTFHTQLDRMRALREEIARRSEPDVDDIPTTDELHCTR